MGKDRCEACKCATCRWQYAGHHCFFNAKGPFTSRCNWCEDNHFSGFPLDVCKAEAAQCKGYQRRYEGKEV